MAIGKTNAQRKILLTTPDTITPTKSQQIITTPDGYDGMDQVTVDAIPSNYIDTSDATATASNILSGKTAYVDGSLITGTIATKTSSNLTASGKTVTVPAGYYASAATKSVSTATQATPAISISSSGVITASSTQSAGYVSSGTKSATYTLSSSDDSDFIPSNIKSGKTIFGVTETLESGRTIETGTFYTNLNTAYTTISVSCSFIPSYFFLFYNGSSDFEYAQYYPFTTFGNSGNWGYGFSYDGKYAYMPTPGSTSSGFGLTVQALPVTVTQSGSTLTFSNIGGVFIYSIMGIGKNYQWVAIK